MGFSTVLLGKRKKKCVSQEKGKPVFHVKQKNTASFSPGDAEK
jgi:hypothetical protein